MRLLKRLFKKRTPTVEMKKYLIVGLGNIGEEYQNTRHNIGFQILDHLAEKNQLSWEVKKLGSYSSLKVKGRQFILIKPNTYMNRSGKSVRYWALQEKIPLENILIATDELHLSFGSIRLRSKGSPAGHNGLKILKPSLTLLIIAGSALELVKSKKLMTKLNLFLIHGIKKKRIAYLK